MANEPYILWADDEIDLLQPHIRFLEERGYRVQSVTNGTDAVETIRSERFDLVFLDEQMPGKDGIEALAEIKALHPDLPVVMITKSEEEHIMEDALGKRISDYLIKPVNPKQILLTCKRLLDRKRFRDERVAQDYLRAFSEIAQVLNGPMSPDDWVALYQKLTGYERELEEDEGLRQVLNDQLREANAVFGRYIESAYPGWIARSGPSADRPVLSHEVIPTWVLPALESGGPVVFLVIDCMRYDQWLEFERMLYPLFEFEKAFHFSILPTATPYSRNAIFSGLLPGEIARRYPQVWNDSEDDETSRNRNEAEFLSDLLRRRRHDVRVRYEKVLRSDEGRTLLNSVGDLQHTDLTAIVVNFVDNLAHSRSDSAVLKEITPDERAYRALTRTWFEHSWLFQLFRELARTNATVIVTTDHGVVRSLHATKVIGDRETSTSLRYKYGRNLKCDHRHAIFVKDPATYGLPSVGINTNYIIAKEDFYFVYPTNYGKYLQQYRDTMQHGGASMEEMILPVVTMRPRR